MDKIFAKLKKYVSVFLGGMVFGGLIRLIFRSKKNANNNTKFDSFEEEVVTTVESKTIDLTEQEIKELKSKDIFDKLDEFKKNLKDL